MSDDTAPEPVAEFLRALDAWGEERLSDLGNARRFARLVGRDVRYVPAWGQWLVWAETHWRRDELAAVERYAQHVIESIHRDAATETDHDRRKALARHALASDSAKAMRGMLALAQSQRGIALPPDAFDRDPWLLNCQNGTLELRTGHLRPHRRADLITRVVPVAFDPAASCPTFEAFLRRIFAERPGLIAFVQRAAGYALTGDTREQCFFVLHGTGANGKSTLVGALMSLFDAYAAQVAAETLLALKGEAPADHWDAVAVHFARGGEDAKALEFHLKAARRAARLYANRRGIAAFLLRPIDGP